MEHIQTVSLFERFEGEALNVKGAARRFLVVDEDSLSDAKWGVLMPELSNVVASVRDPALLGAVLGLSMTSAAARCKARSLRNSLYFPSISLAARLQKARACVFSE